jgi:tRNA-specific 2-thiouridylase
MRVLVAMSGGVDSSVAAALLVEAGHDVTGATLKLWGGAQDSGCCAASDVEDARRVAAQLDVPHYVFNLTEEFEAAVVQPYVDAYAEARTPNPCIECNRTIKWGRLASRANRLGYDAVATGHHARVVATPDGLRLARGADAVKDQSYVLYMLSEEQLARTLLPVGELTKTDVRAHATRLGLRTAAKAESMDVCFISKQAGGRRAFVDARIAATTGAIVATDGRVLGRHDGVAHYTIGQRKGLGVAGSERRFVVDLDAATRTVVLGRRADLLRGAVELRDVVFAGGRAPAPGESLLAQCRAHGDAIPCTIDGSTVHFDVAQPRVAPGQAVVLYDRDVVVGGGVVDR